MKASKSQEITTANRVYDDPSAKYYFLAMMTLTYALNLFDRQLLSMLQESVKAELSLSDTQLGLLTGTAFAFFLCHGRPVDRPLGRPV